MGKKISYGINIYILYMYIRIAFFIELRLRVSRSLRSLANYCSHGQLTRSLPVDICPLLLALTNFGETVLTRTVLSSNVSERY